jgi:spectinomycin phosphotransferase
VVGRNGYQVLLTPQHWQAFGAALQRLHSARLPSNLQTLITHETYTHDWRARLAMILDGQTMVVNDPIAHQMEAWLHTHHAALKHLVARSGQLSERLLATQGSAVVCHGDLHAGNLMIDEHHRLLVVDWDTLVLAPKERDLMFIGGGLGFRGATPEQEERFFYAGYGPTTIDWATIAYYRYERIIQDVVIYAEELLQTTAGGADRAQALRYAMSNMLPNGTIAMAIRADQHNGPLTDGEGHTGG